MYKNIFIALFSIILAGCATSTRYISYTTQQYPPKDKFFVVNVYPPSQTPGVSAYYVIGKISIEGFASNGVNPETLTNQAREVARKRGADAIINAGTDIYPYYGADELLRFKGEMIVYSSAVKR